MTDHLLIIDRSYTAGELKQTKTRHGRTVEIIEPLAADLALLRPKLAARHALVAPNHVGQPIDLRLWRGRIWQPAAERASVEATQYDGRHTYASLLTHEGGSLLYVAASLGHASATTTLARYAHLLDTARHATGAPMSATIMDARAELERSGVRPLCADDPPRILRSQAV